MSGTTSPASGWIRQGAFALVFVGIGAAAMHFGPAHLRWAVSHLHRSGAATSSRPSDIPGQSVDTWVVRRGQLRITFNETGKVRAKKSYPIVPLIQQPLKITFLVPDGSTAKKGDTLVSFDKKIFEDLLFTKRGELDAANREKTVAQAALEISRTTGKTELADAQTKLDEAEVQYRTYVELEGPKKLNELEKSLGEARNKLTESTKAVTDAQQKIDEGLFSEEDQKKALQDTLDNARDNAKQFQRAVDSFTAQKKIFRTYEYPQSMKTKHRTVESAKMQVEKASISAENEINEKAAELAKVEDKIRQVQREIDTNESYLKKCDIPAPIDGLCVYGDPASPYYYGNEIKVGAEWYGGQTLMTIPDLTAFEIDIEVPEDYVGKIKAGIPVNLTFDAIPNLHLTGSLLEIAKLGKARERFDPSGPRVFATKVTINGADPRMVSGMTGKVEMIADRAENVLIAPIDAVGSASGKPYVLVREGSAGDRLARREVTVGRSSNTMVELLSGVTEGERLAMGAVDPGASAGADGASSAAGGRGGK